MKKIAALFDCDGTLYSAQYGRGLIQYAIENGRKTAVRTYYAANLIPYLLRKIQVNVEENYSRLLISRLAWMVQGMTKEDLLQASEWINKEYLLPTENPEIVTRLQEHQSQGHIILLVSAQLYPSLETLSTHYNAHGFVGTKIGITDGHYSGRIIPPVIIGDDKAHYTKEYFSTKNVEIDWEASYAYADAITDMGLFSMVGHPVAVNPDSKLLALAQKGNWEIIDISR